MSLSSLACHVDGVNRAYGGAEVQVTLLAKTLAGMGDSVSVVLTDYSPDLPGRRLTDFPLINAYHSAQGLPGVRFLVPRWTGLHQALQKADADVYFQMCAGVATGQVAFFCRRANRPFVFATASDLDTDRKRSRLGARARVFYKYGLRRADRVITQHSVQAEALERNFGVPSTPIAMGVELPDGMSRPQTPPTVLWLGTVRSVKRPEIFLEMARRFPETRFVMVGGQASADAEAFERIRAEAGTLANVDFRGAVPSTEEFLGGAWVLLNASEREGFPTTFLEAWARGVPTVSFFDPNGVVVQHNSGLVAESVDGLAQALKRILDSRELRDELGGNGRAYVEREHTPQVFGGRFRALFQEAVSAHSQK